MRIGEKITLSEPGVGASVSESGGGVAKEREKSIV